MESHVLNRHCGFKSFFLGGFECSCHVLRSGRRLDMIAATCHDRFAAADYERLNSVGIYSARDGVRWHLIETSRISTTGPACCRWFTPPETPEFKLSGIFATTAGRTISMFFGLIR